ncbi:hypothetical protein HBB16_15925 [Pseudonocardia sp. MCCB 268]|nr:hypothetical protein [Pseudonocardia cytotoxica]
MLDSYVGCRVCGNNAHAAVLCRRSTAPTSSTTPPSRSGCWPGSGHWWISLVPGHQARAARMGPDAHRHARACGRPVRGTPAPIRSIAVLSPWAAKGGNVLADWIVAVAERAGHHAQSTWSPVMRAAPGDH